MAVNLIVARSRNNVIGKGGKIPWKIKGEQSQFKELTTGNVVIMGRKTFEDIGRPLPNRRNIVISNTADYTGENLMTMGSLEQALAFAGGREIFVIGGYRMFEEAIPLVEKMYITEVDMDVETDDTTVFFPEFDKALFDMEVWETAGEPVKYTRTVYTRKAGT